MKKLLLFSMALLISASIYAQRGNNSNYWNTWEYTAKENMVKDFEDAAAKKTAMFNTTDKTAIITYRITTGSNSGTYVRVESQKSAADYDLDRSAEGKYWNENVAKYIAKNSGQVRWQRLNNGSMNYESGSAPSKHVTRTIFNVKADKILHFRRHMTRLAKVGEKRGWTATRLLFRLVSGGNRNQFILAVGFDTFERENSGVEQENTFEEDYDELFGWGSLDEDSQNFDASLEYWGEERESLVLVPEMSTGMMN